jgi:hypothetical protein
VAVEGKVEVEDQVEVEDKVGKLVWDQEVGVSAQLVGKELLTSEVKPVIRSNVHLVGRG